jgi:hypothetical protein
VRQSNHANRTTAGTNHHQFDQKRDENNDSYKKNEYIEDKNQISQSDLDGGNTKDSSEKDEHAEDILLKTIRKIIYFLVYLMFEILRVAAVVYNLIRDDHVQCYEI